MSTLIFELPFLDHMHGFNVCERGTGRTKAFQTQHKSDDSLDGAMFPAIGGLCETAGTSGCGAIWRACVLLFMGGLMKNCSVHEVFRWGEMGRLGAYRDTLVTRIKLACLIQSV